MFADTDNPIELPAPHGVHINCVVVVSYSVGQDVGIVYNLNCKFLCLGPRYFISGAGRFTFAIEGELSVLGNDITH